MTREILKGIYQIHVPLPGNPLKYLNSYLIKGNDRSLLIDTGFNWPECKEAQLKAMDELGMDWAQIDFFITHAHGDHVGLVNELADKDARVYCSEIDAQIVQMFIHSRYWELSDMFFKQHGYPVEKLTRKHDDIEGYISGGGNIQFTPVKEGDTLRVGNYRLYCIETPGHSPGHMCLYEPDKKLIFSGDHILDGITSNITAWGGSYDCLGLYLKSLEKIDALDIKLVLPAHRKLISDYHQRIAELVTHHEERLQEILDILHGGFMSAYQVASRMHWDLTYDSWEEFPDFQRWFATGEAIAHLEHLAERGKVKRVQQEELMLYELA
ncbi:MAG: MBL fold metallo-hydrolase [Syntrophomonadaceae bacterium]|nr:MBL fold metallo-hydrolase [Syntrophomonadaceae bacterium]